MWTGRLPRSRTTTTIFRICISKEPRVASTSQLEPRGLLLGILRVRVVPGLWLVTLSDSPPWIRPRVLNMLGDSPPRIRPRLLNTLEDSLPRNRPHVPAALGDSLSRDLPRRLIYCGIACADSATLSSMTWRPPRLLFISFYNSKITRHQSNFSKGRLRPMTTRPTHRLALVIGLFHELFLCFRSSPTTHHRLRQRLTIDSTLESPAPIRRLEVIAESLTRSGTTDGGIPIGVCP